MSAVALSPEDHFRFFSDFCRYETVVGGPDPHMACVGHMSKDCGLRERVWRAGCYIGVYNVPTAEVIWQNWPRDRVFEEGDNLGAWISENWKGLGFRRERRAVRSPEKLTRYLLSYSSWIEDWNRRDWVASAQQYPFGAYEDAWKDVQQVYGLGRYVALKILEFYQRYCDVGVQLPDLRPKGGWSPRAALALLYPRYAEQLNGDDRKMHLELANTLAVQTSVRLKEDHGIRLSRYNLQVLLCDYKQSIIGQRQYPGRSLDSEIVYRRKVEEHFGNETGMWEAREALFPPIALGEKRGWSDVREELGDVLAVHGYTWTDLRWDYLRTTDLSKPYLWDDDYNWNALTG